MNMLDDDKKRMGYSAGEKVGPMTPEQAFNKLPESLKQNNKIVEVDGKSYVVHKTKDADDVKNLDTDITTTKQYLNHIQNKMEKIIEKDKKINSKMSKASNVAYDVLNSIGGIFNPKSAERNTRKNLNLSEYDKEMLEDYNKRDSNKMGGLLQDDEERMGYSKGRTVYGKEEGFNLKDEFMESKDAFVKEMAEAQLKDVKNTKDRDEFISSRKEDRKATGKSLGVEEENLDNEIKKAVREMAEDNNPLMMGGRQIKNEGGSLLADDMPMMEEEQETHMMPDGTEMPGATHGETLEPDSEMEDGYLDYILGEALSTEEEDMLMSKLEQDGELSVLFDKVVGVAQEFAGSGPVEGPGSGTSDSIPARLSDGEFVFTAKAVEEIGADNLKAMMDEAEMKAGERQGFAEGDVVEEDNVTMPVEKQPMKQDIRVTKETVGAQAGMLEQSDLVDDEVKKSMFRQNRFLG
mgnify:CR=1 FL=1